MNVLGYIRVSTEEQERSGLGLEDQRRRITEEVERRGWELVEIVSDQASGRDLTRPGISRVLGMLRKAQADALVVAKLDRLSRNLLDFAAVVERSRAEGWALVALDIGVDTTTPSGEMVASVMAVMAAFERRLISERTKDALAVLRSQGAKLGRPRSVPDDVVARIVAEHAQGQSLGAIARGLTAEGIPTAHGGARWYSSTVRAILLAASEEAA